MSQLFKVLAVVVALWMLVLGFLFFRTPYKSDNSDEQQLRAELETLKQRFDHLRNEALQKDRQWQEFQDNIRKELKEKLKDDPNVVIPTSPPAAEPKSSPKSTTTTPTTPTTPKSNNDGGSGGKCCKGLPVMQPYDNDCNLPKQFRAGRDLTAYPIVVQRGSNEDERWWKNCDAPCINSASFNKPGQVADVLWGGGQKSCPQQKNVFWTMENSGFRNPSGGRDEIVATTDLKSDVPVQYFNWDLYNFTRPAQKKTATSMAAAFISNCGGAERNEWIHALAKHGVTVDSYGACPLGTPKSGEHSWDYKLRTASTYHFTFAMENSHGPDYVTEKLFEVLAAGSVPIHLGLPDIWRFAPDNHSVINAQDYESPKQLAEHLLALVANETAYEEYLAWKRIGWLKRFQAMMDIGAVHSACRMCIRGADMQRRYIGPSLGEPVGECLPADMDLGVLVRSRGTFWLKKVLAAERTFKSLWDAVVKHFDQVQPTHEVFEIKELWSRDLINTDKQVAELPCWAELEVTTVIKNSPNYRKNQ